MSTNTKKELSWNTAFKYYTPCDIAKDSIIPFLISLVLIVITCLLYCGDYLELIYSIVPVLLDIFVSLVSILLGAFAIWISFFLSKVFELLKSTDTGVKTLNALNASFLFNITFMIVGIVFLLIILFTSQMKLCVSDSVAKYINITTLFFIYFFSLEYVWLLKDVTKNLHSVAKLSVIIPKQ